LSEKKQSDYRVAEYKLSRAQGCLHHRFQSRIANDTVAKGQLWKLKESKGRGPKKQSDTDLSL